jgi:hypothetical protein
MENVFFSKYMLLKYLKQEWVWHYETKCSCPHILEFHSKY